MIPHLQTLLLLATLLLGQTALAMHQVDFDQHADGQDCDVCLVGQALGGAVPVTICALPAAVALQPPAVVVTTVLVARSTYSAPVRAPPLHAP